MKEIMGVRQIALRLVCAAVPSQLANSGLFGRANAMCAICHTPEIIDRLNPCSFYVNLYVLTSGGFILRSMFVFIRTIIYSSLFIGFMLIYLPARLAGLTQPSTLRVQQAVGIVIGIAGALVAFWCIYSFATLGKGTPAPFDPPRQLVTRGPYRMVRNPMYIAAGIALTGGAIYFESWLLIGYTCFLFLITHLLIFWYEEPRLKKTFGETYLSYCDRVGRWWPTI